MPTAPAQQLVPWPVAIREGFFFLFLNFLTRSEHWSTRFNFQNADPALLQTLPSAVLGTKKKQKTQPMPQTKSPRTQLLSVALSVLSKKSQLSETSFCKDSGRYLLKFINVKSMRTTHQCFRANATTPKSNALLAHKPTELLA